MVRSVLEEQVAAAGAAVREAVAGLDPDDLTPVEAGRLLEGFDQIVRAASTGSTLLARRVEDGQEWRRAGFRSAAEWLAAKTGSSLGAARRKVDTSRALRDLPATREQMAHGTLSPEQGETIAGAAKANPDAEDRLLVMAKKANHHELRNEALRARAEADRSDTERHQRLHRERRVRRYTDPEGARHLDICGPVDTISNTTTATEPSTGPRVTPVSMSSTGSATPTTTSTPTTTGPSWRAAANGPWSLQRIPVTPAATPRTAAPAHPPGTAPDVAVSRPNPHRHRTSTRPRHREQAERERGAGRGPLGRRGDGARAPSAQRAHAGGATDAHQGGMVMATADPAQESLRHWTAVAPAWDRYRNHLFDSTRGVSERIVERAEVAPGTTLLELTAGPGDTGFLAADRLGGDGRLISSDFVGEMVESARREGTQRGLTNVDYRVIDATQIDLGDASVDGVISRFGLMLVPEQQRAMAEIRRVLRPGGRLAYGTWGPPDRNPWLFQIVMALLGVGIAPPGDPFAPGGVFSLATEEANRALVESAGFEDVGVDEVTGSMRFDSIDDYWTVNTAVAGPIADLVATLDTERLAQARASLAESIAPFRDGDAVELPWVALVTAAS